MEHSFDVDIAIKLGIQPAIIFKNLYYWIKKNKANNKHFYDGNYWTYNSKKAFSELFPYMTERQIDYAIKKLIDAELVITGNYNKVAYDRTLWYAITKKGYSILQNCEMEETNLLNGDNENVEPIPNKKPNKKSNNKPNTNTKEEPNVPYEKIKDLFHDICTSYPKVIKLSDERKRTIAARYKEYNNDFEVFRKLFIKAETSDFLKGINDRKWKANFDWLINQSNMVKVLEDTYKNKEVNNASDIKQSDKQNGSKYSQFSIT